MARSNRPIPTCIPNGDNCGNSIATSGTQLIDNNIYANHIDNTVALQQGWVQHLMATFGTAANGGVPYYQLDNEPGGWSNTHRDVEPNQPDYDTIISLGQQYAAMIKQTDPSAKVFGPVDFTLGGWIGTPSKQNNLYAGQYYLQQDGSVRPGQQPTHPRLFRRALLWRRIDRRRRAGFDARVMGSHVQFGKLGGAILFRRAR